MKLSRAALLATSAVCALFVFWAILEALIVFARAFGIGVLVCFFAVGLWLAVFVACKK